METRANYLVVAGFFLLSLLMLVIFIFWMGQYNRHFQEYQAFYLYAKELPKGIGLETPVRYLGIPVGFVKAFELSHPKQDEVEILVWIKGEIAVRQGARLVVQTQGLTGGNFFALLQGEGEVFSNDGKKAILGLEENWIEKVSLQAEEVMMDVKTSLNRFNSLLSDENLNNIQETLSNMAIFMHNINQTTSLVNQEIKGLRALREDMHQSLIRGDYNLELILSPLVFELQKDAKALRGLLNVGQDLLRDAQNAPADFFFGGREVIYGPREER